MWSGLEVVDVVVAGDAVVLVLEDEEGAVVVPRGRAGLLVAVAQIGAEEDLGADGLGVAAGVREEEFGCQVVSRSKRIGATVVKTLGARIQLCKLIVIRNAMPRDAKLWPAAQTT